MEVDFDVPDRPEGGEGAGNRTAALASHPVEQMGYIQVYSVRNGITRWISDKLPVTR
ncbi:MAG: hypothetical protein V7629_06280 [Motiliproteus sp.]